MALKYSVAVRNAQLDAFESTVGTTAILKLRTGPPPSDCSAADSGSTICTITLPSPDWMNNAANGQKTKLGVWQIGSSQSGGVAGHWRLYAADGTTCHAQGTVTGLLGGGDMELDNTTITGGQTVTINTFQITRGNA